MQFISSLYVSWFRKDVEKSLIIAPTSFVYVERHKCNELLYFGGFDVFEVVGLADVNCDTP